VDHIFENIYIDAAPDFCPPISAEAKLLEFLREGVEVVISFREYEPFARDYKIMEMDFFHIPIIDFDVPEPEDIDRFINLMEKNRDRKILIHCLAGLGRTGTMVALYLKYRGMSGPIAVHHVRRLRPGAIQTLEQVELVLDYEFQRKHRE